MTHPACGLRWLHVMSLLGAVCLLMAGGGSLAWGQAYVANSGSGTVSVIDTASNTVSGSPIQVGGEPYRVAVTPDGHFVYVTNTTGSVSVIDALATPPAVIKTISLAGSGRGVAITGNGQFAYVVGRPTLHKIDILNNHTPVGSGLVILGIGGFSPNRLEGVAVTPNGSFAYVVDQDANRRSVYVVDAVSMTQVNVTISIIPGLPLPSSGDDVPGPTIGGSFPLDVVARPDSQFVYVSAFSDSAVQAIRVSDHQRVGGWLAGIGPVGVAASGAGGLGNGQSVYAANSNSNSATFTTVNDTSGLSPGTQTFTVGDGSTNNNSPQYLAATPNGQFLYVTNQLKDRVEVFNLTSAPPAKVASIPVGLTPLGIAVSPLASGPPPPPPPPPPPALSASLAAFPVTVTVGQSITVTMIVSNTGGSAASNVAPSPLTLSVPGGAILTSGPSPASATINPAGSQPFGFTYSASVAGSVTFSGSAGGGGVSSPLATSNAVTIQPASLPPTLSVAPGSLGFAGEQGLADPPAQSAQISNSGGGTLGWSITPSTASGGNWLTANPATGSAPPAASTSVAASTCGLPAGGYTGSFVVSAVGANGSPQAIPVTLTVTQPVTPLPSPGVRVCTDRPTYRTGDVLRLSVSVRQGTSSNTGDAYLFAQVPGTTSVVSLVSSGGLIVHEIGAAPVSFGTNFQVQNFAGQVFERPFDGSEPAGIYDVKAILALQGTTPTIPANQLSAGMASFTFAP